jgi:hypothetical protein
MFQVEIITRSSEQINGCLSLIICVKYLEDAKLFEITLLLLWRAMLLIIRRTGPIGPTGPIGGEKIELLQR